MKNDNYLERIAIALETLVGQGNSLSAEFEQPTVEEPVTVQEPARVEEPVTHDDLKQACLVKARADSNNRDKLKALLSSYGAKKAVDVLAHDLAEVVARVESGDF